MLGMKKEHHPNPGASISRETFFRLLNVQSKVYFCEKGFKMTIHIPDDILANTHLSENDLKVQLALVLYSKNILSFGQARRLSGLHVIAFQELLGKNQIGAHYDSEDLAKDLDSLNSFPV
jgi:predicted HTH domain antitoxin